MSEVKSEIHKDEYFTQMELDTLNVAQDRVGNFANLTKLGGVEALLRRYNVTLEKGQSESAVLKLRDMYGRNAFPESPMASILELFIDALGDTTLLILLAAATVSLIIGAIEEPSSGWIEGLAIFIAVFLVASITSFNDYTKELQFRALEASAQRDDRASVLRDGEIKRLNPTEIVVGDILVIQAGDAICADSVIADASHLKSNESGLTGEPDDIKKSKDKDPFLISSCLVTECDETKAIVTGIGLNSQWGKIKANLVTEAVNTPLQDKLELMTTKIGHIGLVAAVATFTALIINIWARDHGHGVLNGFIDAFILSVTIVVVAIPEGLPLAVTIALAFSTKKMYQDQCFIRVLAACETMGNATNICSDKTGTLTENRMTVVEGWFAGHIFSQDSFASASKVLSKVVQDMIAENSCINRVAYLLDQDKDGKKLDRPQVIGNKTEGALMIMCRSWGFQEDVLKSSLFDDTRDKVYAFNSSKKSSTAVLVNPTTGKVRLYCKGATEWVLKDCAFYSNEKGEKLPLSNDVRKGIEEHLNSMADNALRTLCLAHVDYENVAALPSDWRDKYPENNKLICDCIVGIIDPLRGDVKDAVASAQRAGVTVRMVTGDNKATASAIARQCGILKPGGTAVEGPDYRKMTPAEADRALMTLQVMARSSPDDKYLLVTRLNGYAIPKTQEEWETKHANKGVAWNTHKDLLLPGYYDEWIVTRPDGGEVVGVTGDGTNDAPALKAADVGLAMGITGTKVAQAASDIVILDDKFSSIVRAITWGRCVYDSIRKFLQFQLTVNIVALWIVFIGAVVGFGETLNAVQMLWVNLVMDTMGALALATEGPTPSMLERRPYKRSAELVSRPMWRNILVQSTFQLILLLILLFKGAELFNVYDGIGCLHLKDKSNPASTLWDPDTGLVTANPALGTIDCSTFSTLCTGDNDGSICYEAEHHILDGSANSVPFHFNKLEDNYQDLCLTCKQPDYRLNTIIFNTFIYCQFFNEYSSRILFNDLNMFKNLGGNYIFFGVSTVTAGIQTFLVYVGGEFVRVTPLSAAHYFITIGLGAITLVVGVLMRLIPIEESEDDFFQSKSHPVAPTEIIAAENVKLSV